MIVSLEAIFLSTFVMISQNRADAKRQVIADQQWQTVKEGDTQNEELLDLSNRYVAERNAVGPQAPSHSGRTHDDLCELTMITGPLQLRPRGAENSSARLAVTGPSDAVPSPEAQLRAGHCAFSQPSSPSDHGTAVLRRKISSSRSSPGQTPILLLSG
jgi:hypothetical protein